MELYILNTLYLLEINCEGRGVFVFEKGKQTIGIFWEEGGTGPDHYFASTGRAIFYELMEVPCLHGNGLNSGGKGFGLLGGSGAGKSTLSVSLANSGCKILCDDMLALHHSDGAWQLYAGKSSVRLWPDSLNNFFNSALIEKYQRVHSRFEKRVLPINGAVDKQDAISPINLSALYFINRSDDQKLPVCKIEPLSPSEALIALLRESSLSDATIALGVDISRLKSLKNVVEHIPIKRISYCSGYDYLPIICEELSKDISSI